MTGASLAVRLAELGLDAAEAESKPPFFDAALGAFHALAGAPPAHAWWVPGRLEVFGKHTDYAGGRSLVAALPRGFLFLASPRSDDEVRVVDAKERPQDGAAPGHGWRRYVDAVVARLTRDFPGARRGATIVFASDLARAAGMSSSSAIVVGLATCLAHIWQLESRVEWRENIHGPLDLAAYFASLESGRAFGRLDRHGGVGTNGGSEDHVAILFGRPGRLSQYSFAPMAHLGDVRVPDAWRFVIASSGVPASKAGAVRGPYNRLSEGASILLELWNATGPPHESLAAALASSPDAGDRLRALVHRSAIPDWPPDALERRLAHFEIEDAFVPEAARAFETGDTDALAALSDASQHRAEWLLGNQIVETSALARTARESGAFAASSFGAGFGGSVWALVPREAAPAFGERWLAAYRAQYPEAAAHAEAFVAGSGIGVTSVG